METTDTILVNRGYRIPGGGVLGQKLLRKQLGRMLSLALSQSPLGPSLSFVGQDSQLTPPEKL